MRHLLNAVCLFALVLSLAACGGSGTSDNTLATGTVPTGSTRPSVPPAPVPTPTPPLQDVGNTGMDTREIAFASEVFRQINEYRVVNGRPALTWNVDVAKVAQEHTVDMQDTGVLTHDGPAPCLAPTNCVAQRLAAAAITFSVTGENVARGQVTVDEVMAAWKASATHNQNMLDASYTSIGIGFREGPSPLNPAATGAWWTQHFHTP